MELLKEKQRGLIPAGPKRWPLLVYLTDLEGNFRTEDLTLSSTPFIKKKTGKGLDHKFR